MSDAPNTTAATTAPVEENFALRVFIGGLTKNEPEAALNKYVDETKYRDEVSKVEVVTKKFASFGFITFKTEAGAAKFLKAFEDKEVPHELDSHKIQASAAKSSEQRKADSEIKAQKRAEKKPKVAKVPATTTTETPATTEPGTKKEKSKRTKTKKPKGPKKEEGAAPTTEGEAAPKKEKKAPKPKVVKPPKSDEPRTLSTDSVIIQKIPHAYNEANLRDVLKAAGVTLPTAPEGKVDVKMPHKPAPKKRKGKKVEAETKADAEPTPAVEEPAVPALGSNKGYAFIYVGTPEAQAAAVTALNGYTVPVKPGEAVPEEDAKKHKLVASAAYEQEIHVPAETAAAPAEPAK